MPTRRAGFLAGFVTLAVMAFCGGAWAQSAPVPLIDQPLVPDTAVPGGAGFTLTVNGTGFAADSVVEWNGAELYTVVVSSSQMTAQVPASYIATAGTAAVTVATPGVTASNVVYFTIASPPTVFGFGLYDLSGTWSNVGDIQTGDFNNDGIPDLAIVANSGFEILLGNGNGTFQAPLVTTATSAGALAVGDFNGDGKLDILLVDENANYQGGVQVYLGNGDGTFTVGTFYLGPSSEGTPLYPSLLFAGDFNGDGKLDFGAQLCGGYDDERFCDVGVYLGNGDGTFQVPTVLNGLISLSALPAIGDFDGDGILDLAFGAGCEPYSETSLGVGVALGNGDGTFAVPAYYPTTYCVGPINTADFNGDGKLDLGSSSDYDTVSVLLNNGNGTFGTATDYATNSGPKQLLAADFNNDGKTDLAVLTAGSYDTSEALSVLLGNGNGTFQSYVDFPLDYGPQFLATADFNNDGRLDLAVVNSAQSGFGSYFYSVSIMLQGSTSLAPGTLSYSANQDVGTSSSPQVVTLSNYSSSPLTINSISFTGADPGDFTETDNCGSSLASGASCAVNITFTPTAPGTRTASLSVSDNGTFSPQTVSLTGVAVGPTITITPGSLTFGLTPIGSLSPPQQITISNTGSGALTISSIVASSGYVQQNNCGSAVATTCTITVQFSPLQAGTTSGSITLTDNAPGSPQTVSLTGTATAVQISPIGVFFGTQTVGMMSSPVGFTVTNKGSSLVTISGIGLGGSNPGDFAETNNCGSGLSGGASCTINVTFTPTAPGLRSATLSVSDSDPASPQTASLSGSGQIAGQNLTLSTTSLSFGSELVRSTSLAQTVTLTDYGTTAVSIASIVASGDFAATGNCGSSLTSGASCSVNVTFTPTLSGSRTGSVTITDSAPGSPQTVSLAGTGTVTFAQSPTLTTDFFGDGKGEPAIWRPSTGTWYVLSNDGGSNLTQAWGVSGDVPVAADYDGDGKDDFAVWRPSDATWYIIPSSDPDHHTFTQFGSTGDVPVAADYDGDGKADVAVWRPGDGTWYVQPSSGGATITKPWGQTGDVPVIGDYDGDGKADFAVFRPSNGTWYVVLSSTGQSVSTALGSPGDIPVEGDYDGDGKTDYAVWQPSNGTWYVLLSSTGKTTSLQYGMLGDIPVVGDYNGDGKNDYAVFRPSTATWYIEYSSGGNETSQWGETSDIPATHLPSMYRRDKHIANFDGDRKTDIAVFRPSNATWYAIDSSTGKSGNQPFGENGDIIVPGDYDGDGKTDYAVWQPSNQTWYVLDSSTGEQVTQVLGASGDIPVPGDYDGDGKTDYATFRPSDGTWYVIFSSTGTSAHQQWGTTGDIPVPADYDGDGKTDYAIFRPSTATWYVILSSTGTSTHQQLGETGDIPVPGDYDGDTKADFTVFRPSTGTWYTLQSSTGNTVSTQYGENGDIPVAKDYDGDEKTDIAVFRPSNGTWYILQSSNGKTTATPWGASSDVPVNLPTGWSQ